MPTGDVYWRMPWEQFIAWRSRQRWWKKKQKQGRSILNAPVHFKRGDQ